MNNQKRVIIIIIALVIIIGGIFTWQYFDTSEKNIELSEDDSLEKVSEENKTIEGILIDPKGSPNEYHLVGLYIENANLWMIDLETKQSTRLTNIEDIVIEKNLMDCMDYYDSNKELFHACYFVKGGIEYTKVKISDQKVQKFLEKFPNNFIGGVNEIPGWSQTGEKIIFKKDGEAYLDFYLNLNLSEGGTYQYDDIFVLDILNKKEILIAKNALSGHSGRNTVISSNDEKIVFTASPVEINNNVSNIYIFTLSDPVLSKENLEYAKALRKYTHVQDVDQIQWFPDNEEIIVSGREESLTRIDLNKNTQKEIFQLDEGQELMILDLSPDGSELAYFIVITSRPDIPEYIKLPYSIELNIYNFENRSIKNIYTSTKSSGYKSSAFPAIFDGLKWSPDGSYLAFFVPPGYIEEEGEKYEKVLVIADTNGEILNTFRGVEAFFWFHDNKKISLLIENELYLLDIFDESKELIASDTTSEMLLKWMSIDLINEIFDLYSN